MFTDGFVSNNRANSNNHHGNPANDQQHLPISIDTTMHPPILSADTLLYIYYLEGRISKDKTIVNKNYLGTWEEDGFSFVFFTQPAKAIIDALVAHNDRLRLLDIYEMTYEQWQGGKLDPLQIGSFLISPPWFSPPAEEPSTTLTLDPGVVFGNGLHPTTRDCLQAIDIACGGQKVSTMLDLGTGTGILALAAAARGCRRILAVDCNFLAAATARRNCLLNHFGDTILAVQGQAEPFTAITSDLLVANIHYDIMKDIIASPGFLQQKFFILSGLLTSETAKVEEHLATLPVHILKKWNRDHTWHTIFGITAAS